MCACNNNINPSNSISKISNSSKKSISKISNMTLKTGRKSKLNKPAQFIFLDALGLVGRLQM